MAAFKRILLKLSGESLMGEKQYGIDEKRLGEYAQQISEIAAMGVQIGIVIGGGNIFRGAHASKLCMERTSADHIGMLATIINGISLQQAAVCRPHRAQSGRAGCYRLPLAAIL